MRKIYFTSDTHFGHKNIIKYCKRPFKDTYLMNQQLIKNWNSVISPDDLVYHLGDFAFGGIKKYLPELNGEIILIRGNHDRHSDIQGCGLEIHQRLDFEYKGIKFKLNHRPVFMKGTDDTYNDTERRATINLDEYDWIICGHVHEKWKIFQKNINVGVDARGLKPISADDIIEEILSLKIPKNFKDFIIK